MMTNNIMKMKNMEAAKMPDDMLDQAAGGFVGGFLLILNLLDKANDDSDNASGNVIAHGGGVSGSW